jgi:phosphoribosylglycinamide formyltransferase-1
MENRRKRIAIFASGRGSNAAKIMEHFSDNPHGDVALVCSNRSDAGVLGIAHQHGIASYAFDRAAFERVQPIIDRLKAEKIDLIVLAGFLWKIPDALIAEFPAGIVNIHPSLLPKFGGHGMYGKHVHEAVIAAGESFSGITVHLVDDAYDHGARLFQARVKVDPNDTADRLAARVLELEHRFYPKVIEGLCRL